MSPAYVICFDVLYGIDLESPIENTLKVFGFSILITGCEGTEDYFYSYIGESDAVSVFMEYVLLHAEYHLNKMKEDQLPLITDKSERSFVKTLEKCSSCHRVPTTENYLVINHFHHQNLPHTYLCNECNLLQYQKRNAYIYCFDLDKHAKFILSSLDPEALKYVQIVPQSSTNSIMGMTYKNRFVFLDFKQHIGMRLHETMQSLDDDHFRFLKQAFPNANEFNTLKRGLDFPHTSIASYYDFQYEMPGKNDFYDVSYDGELPERV